MDQNDILMAISVVFAIALIGFFVRMEKGFGRFNTSLLILTLVLYSALVTSFAGNIDWHTPLNLIFAVAGYAAALLAKEDKPK